MTIEEIEQEIIRVLENYNFKIVTSKSVKGYMAILYEDRKYVFAECDKTIDDSIDEENEKPKVKKLVVRFNVEDVKRRTNPDWNGLHIGFDYATGGHSGQKVNEISDVKKIIINSFKCHNLYKPEELEERENKHISQPKQLSLFDFGF